ncbi:MaoC/PaaZ C-terminal domain-containing protein [Antribacter gilvus]|uniref:MaoC/PaaZ C-terminal domain-containing protein n=1 Tax=Antribacter gilvus TaxID=2304675 RepID=UPI000F7B7677|nr:MaoC/PaaZ C-terminal domain-containing protein [Antribacter gilvus]
MTQRTGPGTPASYAVVDLPGLPGLGSLYAKGAAGSLTKRPGTGAITLPTVAYRVTGIATGDTATSAHLDAYCRVVGEPSSDVLPAGFLHVLAFPLATAVMVRGDFPLPLLGMVHLRNHVRVTRPVRVGDTLEVRAWAEDVRPHRRGVQVDLVAEVSVEGPDGPGLAWRGVSTYLAKGFRAPAAAGTAAEPAASESRDDWSPPLPTGRWSLGGGTGRAYGAVSGDRNPIHLSALSAKAFGFPRAIAHGMYTSARALAEVGPARRGETYEWTVEFFKPVLLPGTVDVAIRRDGGRPGPGGGYVYDGWRSGKGTRHFTGTVAPLA